MYGLVLMAKLTGVLFIGLAIKIMMMMMVSEIDYS